MMVNDGIRAREVRLIGANGDQLGVKSKSQALQLAEDADLDLVLVAPKAKPPVQRFLITGSIVLKCKRRNVNPVRNKSHQCQGSPIKPNN